MNRSDFEPSHDLTGFASHCNAGHTGFGPWDEDGENDAPGRDGFYGDEHFVPIDECEGDYQSPEDWLIAKEEGILDEEDNFLDSDADDSTPLSAEEEAAANLREDNARDDYYNEYGPGDADEEGNYRTGYEDFGDEEVSPYRTSICSATCIGHRKAILCLNKAVIRYGSVREAHMVRHNPHLPVGYRDKRSAGKHGAKKPLTHHQKAAIYTYW